MRTLKIGVYDEEQDYAERLSAYLNRTGAGKWSVSAYTEKAAMERAASGYDLITATDRQLLTHIREDRKKSVLWLKENKGGDRSAAGIPCVCRYQGARVIAGVIEGILNTAAIEGINKTYLVAVYSPVGRCGKTSLSLQLVNKGELGRWLYIGLEDYSFMWAENKTEDAIFFSETDSFIYFVKERNEKELLKLIENCNGIIPSAFSPFDTKCLEEEDFVWLGLLLQGLESYTGVVFDMGTGVLSDIELLREFDYVIVPILKQDKAERKVEQFRALLKVYGLESMADRILYVNMENPEEQKKTLERVSGTKWED